MSGVDIIDATFEIDRRGGFTAASVIMSVPRGDDAQDERIDSDIVLRDPVDGFVLWEGRVDDPDAVPHEADTLRLECGGFICALEDDEAFVRNYVDSDMTHWETGQASRWEDCFTTEVIDPDSADPILAMYAMHDIEVPKGANTRAWWYPLGVPIEAARIVKCRIDTKLINPSLELKLFSTPGGPNKHRTLEGTWSEDDSYVLYFGNELNITSEAASLVFQFEQIVDNEWQPGQD